MRLALAVALFAACSSKESAPGAPGGASGAAPVPGLSPGPGSPPESPTPTAPGCDTVRVQLDGAKAFPLATRAEYCLFTPDPVACCAKEGTSCEAFAGSAAPVFDIVRPAGCPAPAARE